MKTILLLIVIMSWLPVGYLTAKFKIKIWYRVLIKNQSALKTQIKNWNKIQIIILYLAWPSQLCQWLFDKRNQKKVFAVPIIPLKLFTTLTNRNKINFFLLSNREKLLDFSSQQFNIIQSWYSTFILLGWITIVLWVIELIIISSFELLFETMITLIHIIEIIGKKSSTIDFKIKTFHN